MLKQIILYIIFFHKFSYCIEPKGTNLTIKDTQEPEVEIVDSQLDDLLEEDFSGDDELAESGMVLQPQTLHIKAGQHIGLAGPSGCGKSTLINIILRIHELPGGTITMDGQDIAKVSLSSLRKHQCLCPQHPGVFKERSIYDNIRYGCGENVTEEQVFKAARLARFHEVVDKLRPNKYQTKLGPEGKNLSGGQFQRLAIARAILKIMQGNVCIAVFDESTSALDVETEKDVIDNITRELRKKGVTALFIAHRLSTIKNCDRIWFMKNGKVIEDGNHDELIKLNGYYCKYWKAMTDTPGDND